MTFGSPARCDSAPVSLPEALRMPDLSHVRTFTWDNLEQWREFAYQALTWGEDERNGCYRQEEPESGDRYWYDGTRDTPHSPDEWTPACDDGDISWFRHGDLHRDGDQPALLGQRALYWFQDGLRHRAHGPAEINVDGGTGWFWRRQWSGRELGMTLHEAWADTLITDPVAATLLTKAADQGADGLAVGGDVWVAHILAANPSRNLSADLRAWCALLTA